MVHNFDYNKTYYKVLDETECHHGFQYRDGLNILKEKFDDDPTHSCVPGRLYFTDYEHLPAFFSYGIYIREVWIPSNAIVVQDEDDKWGTNKIILGKRYHIVNHFDKWFKKRKYNYEEHSWALAKYCSDHFDKWFNKKNYNYENDSWALAKYCPQYFDRWFDKDKYNYKAYSGYLAEYCSEHFDKWFNKDLYNYEISAIKLMKYCPKHFNKWYDSEYCDF